MSNSKNLRSLIRRVMDDKGLTYQAVADRAAHLGHKLARSTVHDLATDPHLVRPPSFEQMHALADGLGIDASLVKAAVAADIGVADASDNPAVRLLVASIQGLSEDDLRVLREMAERFARPSEQSG